MKELDKNSNGNRRYLTEAKIVSIKDTTELGGEFYTNCRVEYFDTHNILRSLDTLMPMDEIIGKELEKTYEAILTITSTEEYIHVVEGIYTINIKILSLDDSIKIPGSNKYLKRYKVESIIQDEIIIKEIKYSEALSQIIEIGQNYNVICIFDMDGFMDILQISKRLMVERLFPSITKYISSLAFAPDIFSKYITFAPVKDQNGDLIFSSGNYAVVFKMVCQKSGKNYAVKVFHRHQEGRTESYKHISKHINNTESPYLVHYDYCENEIEVDGHEYPAVIMEWVEGHTLGNYLSELVQNDDKDGIFQLACNFDKMAVWLLEQPFAHGDLKTDNILIDENGTLRLIDYDGMFTPEMQGQHARENGSPGFRHPGRLPEHFGQHIDDFSILLISFCIHALAVEPDISDNRIFNDILLFTEDALSNFSSNSILNLNILQSNPVTATRMIMLHLALGNLSNMRLIGLKQLVFSSLQQITNSPSPFDFADSDLEIFWQRGYCGFRNKRTKEAICTPKYDDAFPFQDGLALVKLNGYYGYINKNGKEEILVKFKHALSFSNGRAVVKLNSLYGYIDKKGEIVIPCIYLSAHSFREGLAQVINTHLSVYYQRTHFIDTQGNIKISLGESIRCFSGFSEGLARVSGLNQTEWFIDKSGNHDLPANPKNYCKYQYASDFSEGLACVSFNDSSFELKCGFIDKNGTYIIPLKYRRAESFKNGIAIVSFNNYKYHVGCINKFDQVIVPFIYDDVHTFKEGLARVILNSKFGFINTFGEVVIPIVYESASDFNYGIATVKIGGKYGCIDQSGLEIIPIKYDQHVIDSLEFDEGLACVNVMHKWGFIDRSGTEIIPLIYQDAVKFKNGLALVSLKNKYGFIDKSGNEVIPFKYDRVNNFYSHLPFGPENRIGSYLSEDYAEVWINEKKGLIDRQGNEIWGII